MITVHLNFLVNLSLFCKIYSFIGCQNCLRLVAHNGFGLCVRAGFGAQSFDLLLKFIRSTKLQVYTSARLTQNPCYSQCFFSFFDKCRKVVKVNVHNFSIAILFKLT
jgi:hypothetical protein